MILAVAACSGRRAGLRPPETAEEALRGGASRQTLFRVDYDGPEGGGRLRLVLRDGGDEGFQLQASDPFGRSLWVLTRLRGESWLVDHRAGAFCRSRLEVSVPELRLSGLSVDLVPRILAGEPPVSPPPGAAEEFRDSVGRRWTVRPEGGLIESWMLWADDGPLLWWRRQPRGGILSHRMGSQFRWRRSLSEDTPGASFAVTIPRGYDRLDCAVWEVSQPRQDQPPPAGGGSPR